MNRVKRTCVYKDCNVNSRSDPHRTLFQFPKDEERAKKWREAGCVDPIENGTPFMCDKHFSRIYVCFSSRRKILLNTAVPIPYGSEENDEAEPEQVQSSSLDVDDITIEEHLDESLIEVSEGTLTEIIYVDQMKDDEPETNTPKRKGSQHSSTTLKIAKIEKLVAPGTSTMVSSSTPTGVILNSTLKKQSPPMGSILRKVKLKKRPTIVPFDACTKSVQNMKTAIDPLLQVSKEPAETTVSSSPEKQISVLKSSPKLTVSGAAFSSRSAKSKIVEEDQQSCSSRSQEPNVTENKNESIYEFIFKGEEYIQMPKAMYHEERNELVNRLTQSQAEASGLLKKLDYYRQVVKDLKEFLDALQEEKYE
ncbi:uncharacterized protein LOC128741659 [Sabethes cyaneus]|uniref:uncharacterized protein LOC128741659 n=1 Tax=Sabethes cyaneus TaxID=53552 RepID=UPI00237D4EF9|nr:uncharacterized protein LOC128741659 [Sabethes cyaneus]